MRYQFSTKPNGNKTNRNKMIMLRKRNGSWVGGEWGRGGAAVGWLDVFCGRIKRHVNGKVSPSKLSYFLSFLTLLIFFLFNY